MDEQELISAFLLESRQGLARLAEDMKALKTNPANLEKVKSIYREIHTLKGSSAVLCFPKLQQLTTASETILGLMRGDKVKFNPQIETLFTELIGAIQQILLSIEESQTEGSADYKPLVEKLVLFFHECQVAGNSSFCLTGSVGSLSSGPRSFPKLQAIPAVSEKI